LVSGLLLRALVAAAFHYRITGKTVTFARVIAKGCSSFRCGRAISMAYPGKSWQRER
jgi:hypothetical protein